MVSVSRSNVHLVKQLNDDPRHARNVDRMPIALLSVYDKTGIVELASGLHQLGWTIVSSGGTAKAVLAAGVPAIDVADLTGVPAILDHRVVTLHPKVHGGSARRSDQARAPGRHGRVRHPADRSRGREPLPVRRQPEHRADRHRWSGDGACRGEEPCARRGGRDPVRLRRRARRGAGRGRSRRATRRRLARDAFVTIAAYDAAIANWFDER